MPVAIMGAREEPVPNEQVFIQSVVDNGNLIVGNTPCHIAQLTQLLVLVGATKTEVEAFTGILRLARQYPSSVVVERESGVGHYLSFIDVQALRETLQPISTKYQSAKDAPIDRIAQILSNPQPTRMEAFSSRILSAVVNETRIESIFRLNWKSRTPRPSLTKICGSDSYSFCLSHRTRSTNTHPYCSSEIHLEKVISPHTDISLGDCSYLDTCFKGKQCKFVHYRVKHPNAPQHLIDLGKFSPPNPRPPQFINANLLNFDLSVLGSNYQALIVDPPWSIHTNPNFEGGCSDDDFSKLRIDLLQTEGVTFLWVTGRVLDLGRKCLKNWGYNHIEELIWLKTNQLGRTICTGRTGHWLNHTKEHVLVGCKGNFRSLLKQCFDSDVIVSNALGKSQKPDELYGIIDRLVKPSAKKLELFGRKSNIRSGWLTIGNELERTELSDPEFKRRVLAATK